MNFIIQVYINQEYFEMCIMRTFRQLSRAIDYVPSLPNREISV